MEKNVAAAFPTLIGRFRLPGCEEMNRALRTVVLERERNEANAQHAIVGGWRSRNDLLESSDPAIAQLRASIVEAVQHMIASTLEQLKQLGFQRSFSGALGFVGWANVSRKGHYHTLHNHPGSCWSGVYYVDVGRDSTGPASRSGVIDLLDPRTFTEMVPVPGEPYGQKISVRPEPGMMLIFPGFLYHFVHPFQGEGERISIAFNARVDRK